MLGYKCLDNMVINVFHLCTLFLYLTKASLIALNRSVALAWAIGSDI